MNLINEPFASWILLVARLCLSLVFLVSAVHKAIWYQKALDEFRLARVPMIGVMLPATILFHLVASICVIVGFHVPEAAVTLAVFTLVATERAHAFWRFEGPARLDRGRYALANLGVIGGLLLLAVVGPGRLVLV
jgi:putative oxidoreductase